MSIAKRIVPLLDRVLVCRFKPLEKTASGLLLPKAAQESLNEGRVVAVGPGTTEHTMTLKVGDRVILPSFGGMTVKLDGVEESYDTNDSTKQEGQTDEYLLFKEQDILAKLNSNEH